MTRGEKVDSETHPDSKLDDGLDDFFTSGMAHTGNSSPFIKDEPDDYSFLSNNYPSGMSVNPNFNDGFSGNVDPSVLGMQNGNFSQYSIGSQQNMSNSFHMGNSGIHDDELLDLDLNDNTQSNFQHGQNGFAGQNGMQNMYPNQSNAQTQNNQNYSHTADAQPSFNQPNFQYNFNQMQPQQISQMRSNPLAMQGQSLDTGFMNAARARQYMAPGMDRQGSDSRSPMTPRTPGISALHLSTPESGSLGSRPIKGNSGDSRRRRPQSGQWDTTTASLPSAIDSPIGSPAHLSNHPQISDVLKSGKHASLPTKVDPSHPMPGYQTQEAKRRRRRESHNQVERRRRDNINEKIHELSELVPTHRLDDEKIRKHLMNSSPLSPTLAATGISPPQATSLLAGGGRRAAGSISMGIPPEEKDKGPNKGDILNGAVSWTRDLMWALQTKYQQESELAEYIGSLGGQYPFQQSEDEKRMRTELMHAIEHAMEENKTTPFSYSRGPGTGLRVPLHTNAAGEPLDPSQTGIHSPQSLSPSNQTGGELSDSVQQQQFWNQQTFKEEDEYNMEMQ